MHKKITRIISMLIVILFIVSLTSRVFAEIDPTTLVDDKPGLKGVDSLYEVGNIILGIFQYIGAGVAVIAALVLAIKYMYSSPNEKADIKSKLIPFIIGGVLVFGAVSLVRLAETFAGEILK